MVKIKKGTFYVILLLKKLYNFGSQKLTSYNLQRQKYKLIFPRFTEI